MPFSKLTKEENLGTIIKKHESGIRETNLGHKTMSGNIGDTLMRDVERKCYVVGKAPKPKRNKNDPVDMAPPEVLTGAGDNEEDGEE